MSETGRRKKSIPLPCGFIDADGKLYETAVIQEMDWEAEMALGTPDDDDDPIHTILKRCIIQVGDITDREVIINNWLPDMLKGDHEWLLLCIIQLTLYQNSNYEFSVACPKCSAMDSHLYDLRNVELKEMPDRLKREMTFTSRQGHVHKFRHMKGSDQEIFNRIHSSNEDVLGKLLALHLVSVDDTAPEDRVPFADSNGVTGLQRLNAGVKLLRESMPFYDDREAVRKMLVRYRGGIDSLVETRCSHCNCKFRHRLPIDPTLLLPSMGRMGAGNVLEGF